MLWINRHSYRIGPTLEEPSGCGQMRERLVEEGLSIGKREPLGLAHELVPSRGVERGTQDGLILFGESHRAGVEVCEQLGELRGNGSGAPGSYLESGRQCRGVRGKSGTEPGQKRFENFCELFKRLMCLVGRRSIPQQFFDGFG